MPSDLPQDNDNQSLADFLSMIPMRDIENYRRLERLSPLEAIRVFLDGDFTIGEDEALMSAIRGDLSVRLSDERIADIMADCMEIEDSPEECYRKLKNS